MVTEEPLPQAPRQAMDSALKRGARSNGIARVSDQGAQSTNGRLPDHKVVSGGDIHGLTRAVHLRRVAEKLRYEVRSDRFAIVRSYVREPGNGNGAG